jgi:aryl-alcohol dehydrogenase-like predicted oxidoreductase
MQMVELGETGIRASYLGLGTGTRGFGGGSDQTRIGHEELVNLLRLGYEQGVTLWDSADGYGSHPHIAEAMRDLERSSVVISTKTDSRSARGLREDVPRFLRELGTDYIDVLLMHGLTGRRWLTDDSDVIHVLREAKGNGVVRAIGMSCHGFEGLERAVSTDWIDVVLARINYAGTRMDASPGEVIPVLERLHDAGKGIIAMKVVGQGELQGNVARAIEFVARLSCVDAMVIGMISESQLRQNVSLVARPRQA